MSENVILSKLEGVRLKFEEVSQQITDPAVISDMKRFVKLNKEYRELEPIVAACSDYKNKVSNMEANKAILAEEKDEELRDMAKWNLMNLKKSYLSLKKR